MGRSSWAATSSTPRSGQSAKVTVEAFAIDRHPVTVAEFRRFVTDTGYVTLAERPPDPALYPDADPDLLVPGSLVFQRTQGPVRLDDVRAWWAYVPGACWTAPEGPGSSARGRHRHPVTHVAYEDALALRALGRQGPADRGRMGIRRAWWLGPQTLRVG